MKLEEARDRHEGSKQKVGPPKAPAARGRSTRMQHIHAARAFSARKHGSDAPTAPIFGRSKLRRSSSAPSRPS